MKASNPLQIVVLAGDRPGPQPLLRGTDLSHKALLLLLDRPMLAYVLQAVGNSSQAPEISLCASDASLRAFAAEQAMQCLPSEPSAVGTILETLERLPGEGPVLFVTCDHPLLTAKMVDYFVEEALYRGLAFAVAAVRRSVVQRQQPQSRRTYFSVKKGVAYSGGNLFLVDRRRFVPNRALMEAVDQNRKAPWRNVLLFDLKTCLRLLFRQWDIHQMADVVSLRFGCAVGVVEMPFAECCMDVDKPSDLRLAEQVLRQRQLRDKLTLNDQLWSASASYA